MERVVVKSKEREMNGSGKTGRINGK